MKQKYKTKINKFKKAVSKLYNGDDCIVGTINNDDYIQMLPCVEILHKKKDKSICVAHIGMNTDMRAFTCCPNCGEEFEIK